MSVVLQWAPYRLREGDWETERDGLADLALKTLEPYAPGIAGLVTDAAGPLAASTSSATTG